MTRRKITRRTVLRGLGTTVALPWLEVMAPRAKAAQAALPGVVPVRAAFVFVPNGAIMQRWTPDAVGMDFQLPPTLEPLASLKKDVLVLSGLAHDKARANGDGAGDHARSAAAFLTGAQPHKTSGRDLRAGVSVDQLAARHLGRYTRLPSLELGCEEGRQAGECDSGYSCAYSSNISWSAPQTPVAKEIDPRAVFTRLFGDPMQAASAQQLARQTAARRSVLDLVARDAADLRKGLGTADQRKVEEYLESVRSIERRLQDTEKQNSVELPPDASIPLGIPEGHREHIRLMMDMLVLAYQTDTTRVATFMLANEGSNRAFPSLEVRNGHHELSHHGNNAQKMEQVAKIDRFYVEQYAYLLERLRSIPEGEGTLLDNSLILYGCAIADGNRHQHHDLPVLLAGRAGGAIDPGRHLRYARDTPMCNLFLSMLDCVGAPDHDRFGDSTGRLNQLTV